LRLAVDRDVQQGSSAKAAETASAAPVFERFDTGVIQAALDPVERFLEVQAAYELLMEAAENGGGVLQADSRGRRKETGPKMRAKTLGEVLVERLVEEPEAVGTVWGDIVAQVVRLLLWPCLLWPYLLRCHCRAPSVLPVCHPCLHL
jgi:hypothetical protein